MSAASPSERNAAVGRKARRLRPGELRQARRCPVLGYAARTQQTAEDLARAVRRLRRSIRRCERCAEATECPLPGYWNAAIHAAIQSAVEAWEAEASAAHDAESGALPG